MADKRIEDMSDDEIVALGPQQVQAMLEAEAAADAAAAAEQQEAGDPPADDPPAGEKQAAETPPETAEPGEDAAAQQAAAAAQGGAGDGKEGEENSDPDADPAAKPGEQPAAAKDPAAGAPADPKAAADTKPEPKQADAVDAIKQLDALYAPFKANGREMKVASVEEARQLMSMGANYNKKMQAMKPHLATLRMLENAGINTEQLGFLIDVHKKDPAAISKLVKDSGIDPLDLSAEKATGYTPGNHRPSDNEVELDAVLQDLQGSDGFARTLDVVSNKMDRVSKSIIAANPGVLHVINGHIENGIYDLVQTEVERKRMFGQLSGLSDLEAYRQVGDEMHASGKFAHLGVAAGQPNSQGHQAAPAPAVIVPDPKKADDSKRDAQKRAVAPVKGAAPPGGAKTPNPDFNPLSLSDEEFAKQFNRHS